MATQSCLVFSGIAPHPPIMVPEVGRESISDVEDSIDAMAELARRVIESNAESIVLISPHAPLEADSFVAYEGPEVLPPSGLDGYDPSTKNRNIGLA